MHCIAANSCSVPNTKCLLTLNAYENRMRQNGQEIFNFFFVYRALSFFCVRRYENNKSRAGARGRFFLDELIEIPKRDFLCFCRLVRLLMELPGSHEKKN